MSHARARARFSLVAAVLVSVASLGCGSADPQPPPVGPPSGPNMSGAWTCECGPLGGPTERACECYPADELVATSWDGSAGGGVTWVFSCEVPPRDWSEVEGVNPQRSRLCFGADPTLDPPVALCSARWPWTPTDGPMGHWVTDRSTGMCRVYPADGLPTACGDGHFNPRVEACDVVGCDAGYKCADDCSGCVRTE